MSCTREPWIVISLCSILKNWANYIRSWDASFSEASTDAWLNMTKEIRSQTTLNDASHAGQILQQLSLSNWPSVAYLTVWSISFTATINRDVTDRITDSVISIDWSSKCFATRCLHKRGLCRRAMYVRPSVRLVSVTFVYCVETSKRILNFFLTVG